MKTIELWKPIKEFPDYEISTYGKVRNKKTGRILKLQILKGYLRIMLHDSYKRKTYRVHRLVAEAFLEDFDPLLEVDHIDDNRSNNYVENLRCLDKTANNRHKKSSSVMRLIDSIKNISNNNSLKTIDELINYLEINKLKIKPIKGSIIREI